MRLKPEKIGAEKREFRELREVASDRGTRDRPPRRDTTPLPCCAEGAVRLGRSGYLVQHAKEDQAALASSLVGQQAVVGCVRGVEIGPWLTRDNCEISSSHR
jgi:hypothetical protein